MARLPVVSRCRRRRRSGRVPEAAGGWSDCVLRQDRDGHWWYESLSGAALPGGSRSSSGPVAPRRSTIGWDDADRDEHRAGVLACLDAIAAGEIYQACVCTQFVGPDRRFASSISSSTPLRAPLPPARRISRALGRRGVAVAGTVSTAVRRAGDVQSDQGHAAASRRSRRPCDGRSRTSPRTS